jgi:hypothetical protein
MPAWSAQVMKVPIDRDYARVVVPWQGGKETWIVMSVRPINGRTMVCGVYMQIGGVPGNAVKELLRSMKVVDGGSVVLSNLSYFNRVDVRDNPQSVYAHCRPSAVKWSERLGKSWRVKSHTSRFEF